jgi:NADH-quinone oxidoreductase subunit G
MPTLTINGKAITVDDGMTVLQACEKAGVEVPVFCYHPKLTIAGNCRMCLVEMEKSPKPVASCAMPAGEGMVIKTDTDYVKKARAGVLELLLINHPLDCPICDQGGECDLQDITLNYGRGSGRFDLNKRSVPEKNMGPLIKTSMNRCIHCTRCVRFAHEIAGVPEMGTEHRGEHVEITSYLNNVVSSELSGNMIDICPVGALTSKPYAYHGRSWELVKTESIDVLDAVGSHIRVDVKGQEVMRILPLINEDINEEWISDRTRFSYDGLKNQRLETPYIKVNGKFESCTWDEAFDVIAEKMVSSKPMEIGAITGELVDVESMMALKDLMDGIGSPHTDCREDGSNVSTIHRSHYLFNTGIANLEQCDAVLLIGTNPRLEAPLVNTRLRKIYFETHESVVANIGDVHDLTYPVNQLGESIQILDDILEGTHAYSKVLKKAKKPAIIIGHAALRRDDAMKLLSTIQDICEKYNIIREDWNGFNILHYAAGRVGGLDIGFVPGAKGYNVSQMIEKSNKGAIKVLYLLGSDELPFEEISRDTFIIYQGHHGDKGAHHAHVILPGCAYTEKNALYVNTEGRIQKGFQAVQAPGIAKEDWKIIRALSEKLFDSPLPYDTQDEIRDRIASKNKAFLMYYEKPDHSWKPMVFKESLKWDSTPLNGSIINNFYMTNSISRHSKIMAQCTRDIFHANGIE